MDSLKKILYIEDEPDIAAIAEVSLRDIGGFNIKTCHSGKAALSLASEYRPDLFLIDVMMPELDGPAVLRLLRSNPLFEKTPIIFMTERAHASEVKEYVGMGAACVITKPFDPLSLADQIRAIWNTIQHKSISSLKP